MLSADTVRDFQLTRVPPAFLDDPYPWYAALRAHDPVHALEGGGVFLARYDDALAVYRSPHASSDKKLEFRPKLGDSPLYEHHTTSLVFNDPPLHTRVRRVIMGAVNQKAIARMEAAVVQYVDTLLAEMADKREVDYIGEFAAQIPIEVIGNMLGIPRSARGPLRGWSVAILSGLEPVVTPPMMDAGNCAVTDFIAYLKVLIDERRRDPGDHESDVLTRLIQGERDGERLTEKELYHQCIFMLNAGHETTTNLIGNGLWALLHNPDELARLRADASLVPSAVEEMLRYDGPIQLNNRRLTAPVEICDRTLPEGTFVTLGIGAANRDPAQFADAERFDVARRPNRHLAFGHGDHVCVGLNVARMEGRIALGRLLARFATIELAGAPERDRRVRFRGFRKLPVRLTAA
ncbi:MAG: cytochrome P450 [Betaproteobacteria bacterium]|nr:cytochrome P450 [Betaproteobacteria bacterium]MDH5221185.1 cytochrome P450 [Betaproteobacteria bacterium]MDH5352489.1 cytochrome P450 [Betaproteobacteria bacterium]